MSARASTLAATFALALVGLPAAGQQVVSSSPLSQVDPWSVGWLGQADGAMPATLWENTDGETLKTLFAALQPMSLSPTARSLLRRIALSSTRPPDDADALVPERLRLIEEMGETSRSIDLRRRFATTEWGKSADQIDSQQNLAAGRTQEGCARVAERRADDVDWMPVRALCLALAGDHDAAGMIAERSGSAPGGGAWLISAIETMRSPTRTKPDGRYGTAIEAAVSIAAKLSAPPDAFRGMPTDLALSILYNPGATVDQRRGALRQAIDSDQVKPADVLAVLTAKEEGPAVSPARSAASARADFLAMAIEATTKGDAAAQATAYAAALKAAESPTDFRIASLALIEAIGKLPKSDAALPHAEPFTRAALAAGDAKLAGEWRKLLDKTARDKTDTWAVARLDLMLSLSGQGAGRPAARDAAILKTLLGAVPAPAEGAAPRNPTPVQRQADLRRIENARILFLYAGTGRSLTPDQRALLSIQRTAGRGVSDAVLMRVHAALEAKAPGEALLAAIAPVTGDTSALSFAGLSDLLALLTRAGYKADADALFLEALQVWKAI